MTKVINTVLSLKDDFSTTLSKAQKNAENAVGRIQKAIGSAGSPIEKLSTGFKAVGAEATRMGQAFMPASMATAGALAGCTKSAADFEQAMQDTWSIASEGNKGSAEAFKTLQQAAKAAGEQGYYSATQAADALGYMALAGWDAEKSAAALPDVLNLAAAASMDLAEASDIVTDYMSAFSNTAMTTTQFTDMLAFAQNNSNTKVGELSEAYKNCAANLNAAGQDVYTVTSMLEAMADRGAKGSEAGTMLAAVMRDLTAKMKDGAIQIGDTAVTVKDASGNYRDLTDIMRDVDAATQGMGTAERGAALSATFTADSISALNYLLDEGIDKVSGYEDALRNSAGAAEAAAAERQKSLYGSLTRLKNQFSTIAIDIGSQYVPYLTRLSDAVSAAAKKFNSLSDRTKTTIAVIAAIVAAIGPVLVITGSVISAVGTVIGALGTVISTIRRVMTVLRVAFALVAANPVLLVIAAVSAAVVVLGVLIYRHWDQIRAKFSQVISALKQGWADFKSNAISAWNEVKSSVSSVINTIRTTVSSGFNTVKTVITSAATNAKTVLTNAFETMKNKASSVVNAIISKFESFKSRISSIVSSVRSKIESVTSVVSSVTGFLTGHATGTPYFTGGLTRVNEHGGEIINLPSGTQIIPHDLSKKQVSGSGVTVNVTVQGNMIGNAEYAEYLGSLISGRIIAAMNNV